MILQGFLDLLQELALILVVDFDLIFLVDFQFLIIVRVCLGRGCLFCLFLVLFKMILQRCDYTALFIKEDLVLALERTVFSDLS